MFIISSVLRFARSIATKAIYELHRTNGKYALVSMCIGGGQGIAVIFERL
jgi:acetyl-CoA C-acetyltransferase